MNKQNIFIKNFAITAAISCVLLASVAFTSLQNQRFKTIDVERINIIEPDGTVKMVITNTTNFPNGNDKINNRETNANRKKRSGMLFFNEDGIECGGFIYDGQKKENGHSAGLSLTFDQYDGDQVMQLLTQDSQVGDNRYVTSSLIFNDRPAKETQAQTQKLMQEIEALKKENPAEARKKYEAYTQQGLLGGAPRVMLGKTRSLNNGLFLFDEIGTPRAMFYIDKNNEVKLEIFDEQGKVLHSWPTK